MALPGIYRRLMMDDAASCPYLRWVGNTLLSSTTVTPQLGKAG